MEKPSIYPVTGAAKFPNKIIQKGLRPVAQKQGWKLFQITLRV